MNRHHPASTALVVLTLALAAVFTLLHGGLPRQPSPTHHAPIAVAPSEMSNRARRAWSQTPIAFEPNRGQSNRKVEFLAHGPGYTVFLTTAGAAWRFAPSRPIPTVRRELAERREPGPAALRRALTSLPDQGRRNKATLSMKIEGARSTHLCGSDELASHSNYFLGNDPRRWRTAVPSYARVSERDLYSGIDLVYYGRQDQLEYDFMVAPGADPTAIRLAFEARSPNATSGYARSNDPGFHIAPNGDLVTAMNGREVRFLKPTAYQPGPRGARQLVDANFVIERRQANGSGGQSAIRFHLAPYDHRRPLVIDPAFAYSTYLGGSDSDGGLAVAVDSSGNAYVTGYTLSTDFPSTSAFQNSIGGGMDAFVAKLKPDGSGLVYSTYLGGSGDEDDGYFTSYGGGIAVDASGSAYLTGYTDSPNFPLQNPLASNKTLRGTSDGFVTKLSADGSSLIYSTYLGGSDLDFAAGIAVDSSGNAAVTGSTFSTDFPVTSNAYQKGNFAATNGGSNAFVAELNPDGSSLTYSSYLGGSLIDAGLALAADSSGALYATGETYSVNFPVTSGAYNTFGETSNGTSDGWLTKIDPTKSGITSLAYSTYFGGSNSDAGMAVAVDASGDAYVTGATISTDYPATIFHKTFQGGMSDSFLTKFKPDGSGLTYSTYLGGSGDDTGNAVAVDATGAASVVGTTSSTNFPVAAADQSKFGGGTDAFYSRLKADGSGLTLSTYLGGGGEEDGYGVALDAVGSAYVTGDTQSTDFPVTSGSFQTVNHGAYDAFVTKLAADFSISASAVTASVSPGSAASYTLTIAPVGGFDGLISLSCAGLPSESNCAFSPPSATLNGSDSSAAMLTITTAAPGTVAPSPRSPLLPNPPSAPAIVLLSCLALAAVASRIWTQRQGRGFTLRAMLAAALLTASLAFACGGGGGSSSAGGGSSNPGTPAGSYMVTVTATSGSSLSHTLTLTLTVN